MVQNRTFMYTAIPEGVPVPGKDLRVDAHDFDADAAPPKGGLTAKTLYASLDPFLRGRMRDPSIKSYFSPLHVGDAISNSTLCRVLKSDNPDFKEGDIIRGYLIIAEYVSLTPEQIKGAGVIKVQNPHKIPVYLYLSALGMPGLTAFSSLYDIGQPKKGETIFISAASGAVGQIVGQLAKHEGLKVLGSVGSQEKLDFITKELGFDGGFNYKEENPADALKRLAPQGIDIDYENVGGEQLDAALAHLNDFGRIVMCGLISQYSAKEDEKYRYKNISNVLTRRLTMRGFIVGDANMGPNYTEEHQKKVSQWVADGSFRTREHFTDGIDNAAEAFVGMLQGKNFGKAILKISEE